MSCSAQQSRKKAQELELQNDATSSASNNKEVEVSASTAVESNDTEVSRGESIITPTESGRVDFSGVWKRTRTENFEAFVGMSS